MPKNVFFFFLSALLFISATSNPQRFWIVSFFCLVPFFIFLDQKYFSFRKKLVVGFLFLIICSFATVFLVQFFSKIQPAEIAHPLQSLFSFTFPYIFPIVLFTFLFGFGIAIFLSAQKHTPEDILFGASFWILLECIIASLFFLLPDSASLSPNQHFPFAPLGTILVWSPFVVLVPYGGIYLFSFLVVATNIALFRFSKGICFLQSYKRPPLSFSAPFINSLKIILIVISVIHIKSLVRFDDIFPKNYSETVLNPSLFSFANIWIFALALFFCFRYLTRCSQK